MVSEYQDLPYYGLAIHMAFSFIYHRPEKPAVTIKIVPLQVCHPNVKRIHPIFLTLFLKYFLSRHELKV